MAYVADRQSLIDRLVALHGGDDAARQMYEQFTDADLQVTLQLEQDAEARIRDRGRLEAVWGDDGATIISGEGSHDA